MTKQPHRTALSSVGDSITVPWQEAADTAERVANSTGRPWFGITQHTATHHRAESETKALAEGRVDGIEPTVETDPRPHRTTLPLIGIAGFLLTAAGLAGVGDAPHPKQSGTSIAAHFQQVSTAVLVSAPLGQLGAVAVAGFVLALARRLQRDGVRAAGVIAAGGLIASSYLLLLHVVYTSLSYEVASSSAETTKAFFVGTILAVPVFGLGVAAVLGGAAYGAATSRLLPAWWAVVSGTGACLAALAVVAYADSGFFSPDVQQQVVANVLLLWLLVTAATLAKRQPGGIRYRHPIMPTGRVMERRLVVTNRRRDGSARRRC